MDYQTPEEYVEDLIDEIHETEDKSGLPRGMIAHYMISSKRYLEGVTNYPMNSMEVKH